MFPRLPVSAAPCYRTQLCAETRPSGRTGAVLSKALPGPKNVLGHFPECTTPGADRGGRESAPLLQTVTHQKGQTGLLTHFSHVPCQKISFKSCSPDWSNSCLDGAKVREKTTSDFLCADELTGDVKLCARKCDRIDDGCQRKNGTGIDEIGCSPPDHTWTGIGAVLVMVVVIILLIESTLYK